MDNRLDNNDNWVENHQELGPGKITLFDSPNGQQTDFFYRRATFFQLKQRSSELEGKLQTNIKIRVVKMKIQFKAPWAAVQPFSMCIL